MRARAREARRLAGRVVRRLRARERAVLPALGQRREESVARRVGAVPARHPVGQLGAVVAARGEARDRVGAVPVRAVGMLAAHHDRAAVLAGDREDAALRARRVEPVAERRDAQPRRREAALRRRSRPRSRSDRRRSTPRRPCRGRRSRCAGIPAAAGWRPVSIVAWPGQVSVMPWSSAASTKKRPSRTRRPRPPGRLSSSRSGRSWSTAITSTRRTGGSAARTGQGEGEREGETRARRERRRAWGRRIGERPRP